MGESTSTQVIRPSTHAETFEILDAPELARRLTVPVSWVREMCRTRIASEERIPHLKLGRYRRFRWNSPELNDWLNQRMNGSGTHARR